MSTIAALMTSKATGAIATVKVFGTDAKQIICRIFSSTEISEATFENGNILLGSITDENQLIDEVTVGCEDKDCFAVHCHGNPLIVQRLMNLLKKHNIQIVSRDKFLSELLSYQKKNSIEIEAAVMTNTVDSLAAVKIITHQIKQGLYTTLRQWQDMPDHVKNIKSQAGLILAQSEKSKFHINPVKIAIVGPPNTGKSTLLNALAGKKKAIVSDIKGTTRDYVTVRCDFGPLPAELIDTAGLFEQMKTSQFSLDRLSQQKSLEVIIETDMIFFVLDASRALEPISNKLIDAIKNKKVIMVLNKNDLQQILKKDQFPKIFSNTISISALKNTGLQSLVNKTLEVLGITEFDIHQPLCFTERQRRLLEKIINTDSKEDIDQTIEELLYGKIVV